MAGGCSLVVPTAEVHGIRVSSDDMKELVPGTTTKADVTALLGTPTSTGAFDDNVWIYAWQRTRMRIAQVPGVIGQDSVELTFNHAGVLEKIHKAGMKQAQEVTMVTHTTPSPGTHASFLQQLLGNVGRVSPLGASDFGASTGGSTGLGQ